MAEDLLRYVEVKSTRSPEPIFIISDGERVFSGDHASDFSLLIITGIDIETRTHQGAQWYEGEVDRERFDLRPLQWRGQGPAER